MTISVIIPAYNVAPYIGEAVASALRGGDVREVIIVDDGSTDATAAVLARLAAADNRIKVLTQPNRGSSSARNAGAKMAHGKYLSFLDGDDRLMPNALAPLTSMLAAVPGAVCAYGNYAPIDEAGQRMPETISVKPRHSGFVLRQALKSCFITTPGIALVRADAFHATGGFNEKLTHAEDWDFWCRLSLRGDFLYRDVCVLDYRVHAASKSAHGSSRIDEVMATLDVIFANPALKDHIGTYDLMRLKRLARARALHGIATRDFLGAQYGAALRASVLAVRAYPPVLPRVIARMMINIGHILARAWRPAAHSL